MTSAVTAMPSSVSSGSTDHRRSDSEAGPHGFTAVNITPPQSRGTHEPRTSMDKTNGGPESSATSPDVSPRQGTASAGRHGTDPHTYMNSQEPPSHKRRRSMSSEKGPSSPRRYDYNPPKKLETQQQHLADRALHVLDSANHHPPSSYYSTTPAEQDRPVYSYERSPYSTQNGVHPDGRNGEAFSREASEQHYQSPANGIDQERADDGKEQPQVLQPGQKRKRNFSNRTKTGCITCRSRKKKCDEGRPYCNNCIRGGFPCQGYNHTRPSSWAKPTPQKQPIPLQSKENDEQTQYENTITPVSANPSSAEASQMRPSIVGDGHDQSRPQYAPNSANPADSRPQYSGQQQHQPQWPQHATPHPPPHQQHGPPPQTSYSPEQLPPLSELSRPEQAQHQSSQPQPPQSASQHHPQRQDYSTTPQRDMPRPPTQSHSGGPPSSAPPPHWQQQHPPQQQPPPPPPQHHPPGQAPPQYPPPAPQQQEYGTRPNPYPPRIDTNQPQYSQSGPRINTANTASASYSSYEQKAGSKLFTNEDVERSRMLRGANYNYFDKTLHNERQRCANALLRYNNACQLGSGVSDTELQNMLLKVFIPKKDQTHSFLAANPLEGSLGPGVKIEPGFRCTYGYNIRIYDNVFIGENTRIDDSSRVEIGSRTWIGANVTILTNDVNKETQNRKGTDGQQCVALPVTIGSEVVVGTGAVILPGRKLGRGSTVEPFAVVKTDLADYETQKVYEGPRMGAGPLPGYGMMG